MKFRNLLLLALLVLLASTAFARWIKDKAYIETESFGNITFSHYIHLDAVGSDCPTCHNDVFHILSDKNPTFTMAEMAEGKSCGHCHNGRKAFSTDEDCTICHAGDLVMNDPAAGKTPFSHSLHLEMDFGCDDCHPDLFKAQLDGNNMTMAAMDQGEQCGACHDGDTAFSTEGDCVTCHTAPADVKMTGDATGITMFSHSLHLDMDFGCADCHPDLFKPKRDSNNMTMAAMSQGEYCGACHDGDTAFSSQGDCATCHAGDIKMESESTGITMFSHSVHIEMDFGCDDCHPDLFKPAKGSNSMTMAAMDQGEQCGACHDGDTAFSTKGDCGSCHTAPANVEMTGVQTGVTVFSHSVHLDMDFGCDDCHPDLFVPKKDGNDMTMAAMNDGEYCGACHDGDTAFSSQGDCATCHAGDVKIQGEATGTTLFSHSVHLEMDFGCGDCHTDLFVPKKDGNNMTMSAMNGGEQCGACHDGDTAFSTKGDCATCHAGEIKMQSEATGTTLFSHSLHLDMDFGCSDCHPDMFKPKQGSNRMTMADMYKGGQCGACHDGNTAFSVRDDCAGCHAGDIEMQGEATGTTLFSHSLHLEMDFGCSDCHSDLFIPKKGGNKMTMAAMNDGGQCGACHDGDTAFSTKGDCATCHAGDIEMQGETTGATLFSHSVHIEMDFGCDDCHPDLFIPKKDGNNTTMAAMNDGEQCGACHDGDTAFSSQGDCTTCHAGDIKTPGGALFSHSLHLDMDFGCSDCHPDLFKPKKDSNNMTMAAMEDGEQCGACHDGDTAFSSQGDCATCHTNEPADVKMTDNKVGATIFNHALHLDMDFGCNDCHPDLFIPKKDGNNMTMATMSNGEHCGACHDGDTAFSTKGDCVTCHAGDIEMQGESTGTTLFSHSLHLDMDFGCDDCHPDLFVPKKDGNNMTMAAMNDGEQCGVCHDGDTAFSTKGDCATCHAGDIKGRRTVFSHSVHLDMDFGCSDCHPDLFKPKKGSNNLNMAAMENGEQCGACHDGNTAFSVSTREDCSGCH